MAQALFKEIVADSKLPEVAEPELVMPIHIPRYDSVTHRPVEITQHEREALQKSALSWQVPTVPGINYLIERNSEYTELTKFLGSDYFTSRLPIDINKLPGPYEQVHMVRRQMIEMKGDQRLRLDQSNPDELARLYRQGIEQMSDLQLTPTIALTKEQVANL